MFALALWDRQEKALYLARDRVGEKPLFYGVQNEVFLFGSELKAIKKHPAFDGEIDRGAVALQAHYGYVPTPHSIYVGIKKLPPGTILKVEKTNGKWQETLTTYWSLSDVIAGRSNNYTLLNADVAIDA